MVPANKNRLMDLTETAAFRIGVKQVDRLFNAARLDCAVSLIGASLLIAAVWVGNGSNTLFALCDGVVQYDRSRGRVVAQVDA